jgi:hypothetical protein
MLVSTYTDSFDSDILSLYNNGTNAIRAPFGHRYHKVVIVGNVLGRRLVQLHSWENAKGDSRYHEVQLAQC